MREQSYVPYAAASGLAGRHSHILGVLVPSLSWPFIPDILQEAVNSSTATGAFTEAIVKEMAAHTQRPIIFPLSNPTERMEATPAGLFTWTDGWALVAAGIPARPVTCKGVTYASG